MALHTPLTLLAAPRNPHIMQFSCKNVNRSHWFSQKILVGKKLFSRGKLFHSGEANTCYVPHAVALHNTNHDHTLTGIILPWDPNLCARGRRSRRPEVTQPSIFLSQRTWHLFSRSCHRRRQKYLYPKSGGYYYPAGFYHGKWRQQLLQGEAKEVGGQTHQWVWMCTNEQTQRRNSGQASASSKEMGALICQVKGMLRHCPLK